MSVEPEKGLSTHLFFLLDNEESPALLKKWLISLNLNIPLLKDNIKITKSNVALRWPLDITTCQNDKLLYIAPPTLSADVYDLFDGEKIKILKKKFDRVQLSIEDISVERNLSQQHKILNDLRCSIGLPIKRRTKQRMIGSVPVAKDPGILYVTGIKTERGYTYLNLNGGDSWGYYHPEDNPEILYNFKGEPNYLIQELLPEYYPDALKSRKGNTEFAEDHERYWLAFRDKQTDQYYVGYYDFDVEMLDVTPVSSTIKLRHFLKENSQPIGEFIPTWRYEVDFANDNLFDPENKFINQYQSSLYVRNAEIKNGLQIPPVIHRVIDHALGNDPALVDHFINWLAVIIQYRVQTQMSWVIQGVPGTGKGLLFNKIIQPLVGMEYCQSITIGNFEEQFNQYVGRCLILLIDEADTDQINSMSKVMAKIKNYITEPRIAFRAMRQDLSNIDNHLNIIITSNRPNSMRIESDDRRFTVVPRQMESLLHASDDSKKLIDDISNELPAFADYLLSYTADCERAMLAIENDAKHHLQNLTETSAEKVAKELLHGNLIYFLDNSPDKIGYIDDTYFDGSRLSLTSEYRELLSNAVSKHRKDKSQFLSHSDLFVIFQLLVGKAPNTRIKLTKYLGHHMVNIAPIKQGETSKRGILVKWAGEKEEVQARQPLINDEANDRRCA